MKTSVFQIKATALQSSPYNMENKLLECCLALESLVRTSVGYMTGPLSGPCQDICGPQDGAIIRSMIRTTVGHRTGPLSDPWLGHQWATGLDHYPANGQDISGPQDGAIIRSMVKNQWPTVWGCYQVHGQDISGPQDWTIIRSMVRTSVGQRTGAFPHE